MSVTVARRHCDTNTVSIINGVDEWWKVPLECGIITILAVPTAGPSTKDTVHQQMLSFMGEHGIDKRVINVNVNGYTYQYLIYPHIGKALLIDLYTSTVDDPLTHLSYIIKAENACRMGMVYVCIDWVLGVAGVMGKVLSSVASYPHGSAVMVGFKDRFVSWNNMKVDEYSRILAKAHGKS